MKTQDSPDKDNTPPLRPEDTKPTSASEELTNQAKAAYQWWDNLATFHAEDPWWVGGAKILVRIVGILVLIALSPLILLGLFFAFLAVA